MKREEIIFIDDITKSEDYVKPTESELWESRELIKRDVVSHKKEELLECIEESREKRKILIGKLKYSEKENRKGENN